jgi:uncharacterized protein (TIGR00730 family)
LPDPKTPPEFFPKAYDNPDFLHSPNSRTIRMLAEYLEPQMRLRNHKVRGTVVFFGSARALAPEELPKQIELAQQPPEGLDPQAAEQMHHSIHFMKRMSRYYEDAVRLASMLTTHFQSLPDPRFRHLVASGGGPGIMEAANRGAAEAGGKTVGFGISLPLEQGVNRFLHPGLTFEFHYFFMRKYWFVYLAKGLVIFPGGFGTMDELFEVLTLIQTHKLKKKLPIVLYGSEYWNDVIDFKAMVKWMVVSPQDLELFKICDTPQHAFDFLTAHVLSGVDQELQESPTE